MGISLGIFRSQFPKGDMVVSHLLIRDPGPLVRLQAMKGNEMRPDVMGKTHQLQVWTPEVLIFFVILRRNPEDDIAAMDGDYAKTF